MSLNRFFHSLGFVLICASSAALADGAGDWSRAYTVTTKTQTYEVTHTPEEVCLISDGSRFCAGKGSVYQARGNHLIKLKIEPKLY